MTRDLTKWPRLLVVGDPITEERADEILVRTCEPSYLDCNDREWNAIVDGITRLMITGWRHEPAELRDDVAGRLAWHKERWAARDERRRELGILNLSYLHNNRISSTWIGGPHGWCDWDGTIGCASHNVGKWPTSEEITADWTTIAAAFPFLRLTAQLISNEGGYEIDGVTYPGELVGQWVVADGGVTVTEDLTDVMRVAELVDPPFTVFTPGRERGVEATRLRTAVERVEARMRNR